MGPIPRVVTQARHLKHYLGCYMGPTSHAYLGLHRPNIPGLLNSLVEGIILPHNPNPTSATQINPNQTSIDQQSMNQITPSTIANLTNQWYNYHHPNHGTTYIAYDNHWLKINKSTINPKSHSQSHKVANHSCCSRIDLQLLHFKITFCRSKLHFSRLKSWGTSWTKFNSSVKLSMKFSPLNLSFINWHQFHWYDHDLC